MCQRAINTKATDLLELFFYELAHISSLFQPGDRGNLVGLPRMETISENILNRLIVRCPDNLFIEKIPHRFGNKVPVFFQGKVPGI